MRFYVYLFVWLGIALVEIERYGMMGVSAHPSALNIRPLEEFFGEGEVCYVFSVLVFLGFKLITI